MPNVEVNGQSIHYTDQGQGPVFLASHATRAGSGVSSAVGGQAV
ncbi:hypothetical protein [Mycobacteroides chelonae]|nr:hypothetical protein [Mycobacteroides chelonae]